MALPDAILLAGGRGTRVAGLYPDVPKPLIPFHGRPFVEWLVRWLIKQGTRKIVLALGFGREQIRSHFDNDRYLAGDVQLTYSEETAPLGTGGALIKASRCLDSTHALVLNGDSICLIDVARFVENHLATTLPAGMVCTGVDDVARFGAIECEGENIASFVEKGTKTGPGLINGGIYCIESAMLQSQDVKPCSLEIELFPRWLSQFAVYAHQLEVPFIDIGTPESLQLAASFLAANQIEILGA
ncbi:MAG: sugar phosphate nucleotidyltransferase [Pseudomonadota bacterium]|nr:sugar phosphate nucleotidyltransferase [Pseudomonadota bacterium]